MWLLNVKVKSPNITMASLLLGKVVAKQGIIRLWLHKNSFPVSHNLISRFLIEI